MLERESWGKSNMESGTWMPTKKNEHIQMRLSIDPENIVRSPPIHGKESSAMDCLGIVLVY